MFDLQKNVNNQVTVGVLLGGLCLAFFFWFALYSQERADSFASYNIVQAETHAQAKAHNR